MIDVRLQVMAAEAVQLDENSVELAFALAMVLPGPSGGIPVQAGFVRVPMSKDSAKLVVESLNAAIEGREPEQSKESNLLVAKSLQGVEQAVQIDKKIKGKKA